MRAPKQDIDLALGEFAIKILDSLSAAEVSRTLSLDDLQRMELIGEAEKLKEQFSAIQVSLCEDGRKQVIFQRPVGEECLLVFETREAKPSYCTVGEIGGLAGFKGKENRVFCLRAEGDGLALVASLKILTIMAGERYLGRFREKVSALMQHWGGGLVRETVSGGTMVLSYKWERAQPNIAAIIEGLLGEVFELSTSESIGYRWE